MHKHTITAASDHHLNSPWFQRPGHPAVVAGMNLLAHSRIQAAWEVGLQLEG